jgi:hypothetical protein
MMHINNKAFLNKMISVSMNVKYSTFIINLLSGRMLYATYITYTPCITYNLKCVW